MASSVIHMAIANEINKKIKRDNNVLVIGSIAPDISKQIGETKLNSHFLDSEDNNVPNIEKFLKKYRNKMTDDFVLGYFIHLYTDYLWFKYFLTEFLFNDYITKLDGTIFKCREKMLSLYIYNDYTNLNAQLINKYNIDLNVFYDAVPQLNNIIEEIPMTKIRIIIDKSLEIIEKAKEKKALVFNIENIDKFISTSVDLILAKLQELELVY